MLRLVFSPKTHLFTQHNFYFCSLQALEQVFWRQWKGLSRCVCLCRSFPIPTTHLNYNFADTSLIFCLCAVKQVDATLQPPPFWVDAAKTQSKVRNQVFLPCPLTTIHPQYLPPLPLILSHIKPCVFLVYTQTLPFLNRFLAGKEQFLSLFCWCLALCFLWQVRPQPLAPYSMYACL